MKQEFQCVGCGASNQSDCLDLGRQPLANRFKKTPDRAGEYRHPLVLGQCPACGLIQSLAPVPADEMRPRESWISYREPDFHFAEIAAAVVPLLRNGFSSLGLSHYDLALLETIHSTHPHGGTPPRAAADLGIRESPFGMETVQRAFSREHVQARSIAHERHDLVVARYVLEHAEQPLEFLRCARELLAPSGLLLLEIPNVRQPFESKDYHVIWEEHIAYLMEHSLHGLLTRAGFALENQILFPSNFEQPWVIVARRAEVVGAAGLSPVEEQVMTSFVQDFDSVRTKTVHRLQSLRAEGRRLMLFGAGHFAVAFINFFGLEDYVDCVVDDDANKVGTYLPGTALPIRPSTVLQGDDRKTLIFCVNPSVEEKLKAKLAWFYQAGGRSCSIFSRSPDYLLRAD